MRRIVLPALLLIVTACQPSADRRVVACADAMEALADSLLEDPLPLTSSRQAAAERLSLIQYFRSTADVLRRLAEVEQPNGGRGEYDVESVAEQYLQTMNRFLTAGGWDLSDISPCQIGRDSEDQE